LAGSRTCRQALEFRRQTLEFRRQTLEFRRKTLEYRCQTLEYRCQTLESYRQALNLLARPPKPGTRNRPYVYPQPLGIST